MIDVAELVAEARRWIGVPFVHQGRTRFGVDCVGLALCVRNSLEPWPEAMAEPRNYHRRPAVGLLARKAEHYGAQVAQAGPGLVALIKWPADKVASHVGILTGSTIIHAYQRVARVVEVGYRDPWVKWTVALYRLPGVRYE